MRLWVIDADRIGQEQLTVQSIRDRIVNAFGDQVLDPNGQIDRSRLAAEVFGGSSSQHHKRAQLNEIVHPAILAEIRRLVQAAPQDAEAIILDAALLLEADLADECDALIFVDTPIRQRQVRVAETRGWSIEEHERREASQWSLDRKRRYCQFIVDNSGTPEAAAIQMEKCLKEIIERTTT